MSNKQQNIKSNTNNRKNRFNVTENNNYEIQNENDNLIKEEIKFEEKKEIDVKANSKKFDQSLKRFGIACIIIVIVSSCFVSFPRGNSSKATQVSEIAKYGIKDQLSTSVKAGSILRIDSDDIKAKDFTITHKSDLKDTKIWVWDYADEDGDYVQVLVDGVPVGDIFMIKHKPRAITVPTVGKVQIKGIKDGGGGITYAVRYDINGTSYFNATPEGEANTYTLNKE